MGETSARRLSVKLVRSVLAGTAKKPCWSESTPAMLVTGSDWMTSCVMTCVLPVRPRGTRGAASATMRCTCSACVALVSCTFCSRVTSICTATPATSTLWKPMRRTTSV